jgi:phosphoribosylformimino-5-aminoimidazole carboxamide ribotide isomerase
VFRPCIDLRRGEVVQIVGGTLTDDSGAAGERTNFVSTRPSSWYAELYRRDRLTGGHVIMLGPGNEAAARAALAAWPGGMQVGGGIDAHNAASWLEAGASHVVVTSALFEHGELSTERLDQLLAAVGREHLVIDLSFRWRDGQYWVVTDRWQKFANLTVDAATLESLAAWASEFLVHGVDVEGLSQGIDLDLVALLGASCPIPCTYAGGARSIEDLVTVHTTSEGRVDLTIGSALDIFGGSGVRYADCVAFNHAIRGV